MLDRQATEGWSESRRNAGYALPSWAEPLTPREAEVMEALAGGLSRPRMAKALGISANTVKYHLRNIYAKLGVCSSVQALRMYVRG
ncbi:LuxR family transcriptional regulator [Solimonas sp. K1W22B-7]|uniref:response regulator transcription factor n=1 Tax=Solimonas sp. K1W22B-7 TaxID=2303331 RepID=UPI000E32EF74|nr:helix-turn-helix transcriptional regulator [Solimonas sp. K1W22B-7]AXQ28495.1 LuxR family transcriptional regulator [Solimonas sp. K1W22B-7]